MDYLTTCGIEQEDLIDASGDIGGYSRHNATDLAALLNLLFTAEQVA